MQKSNKFYISLLLLLWVVILILTYPTGNFPINDDWQYARSVNFLLQDHTYKIIDPYSPILFVQVLWGTLFCLPFGFSFVTLRISVIVLSIVATIALYLLFNRLFKNNLLAFIGTLLLAFNPIFFLLANSFMSDTPLLCFSLLSFLFFFRAIEKPSVWMVITACIIATLATLTRQFGIIIPIAFSFTMIIQRRQKLFARLAYLLPTIIIAWILYTAIQQLHQRGFYPYGGRSISSLLKDPLLFFQTQIRCGLTFTYAGFFLLPFLLLLKNPFKDLNTRQRIFLIVFIALFIKPLIMVWDVLPCGNYVNTCGAGPPTIKFLVPASTDVPLAVLYTLRCIAYLGAILLLAHMGKVLGQIIKAFTSGTMTSIHKQKMFISFCAVGYAFLMIVSDAFFDRYMLYFFPLFLIILWPTSNELFTFKRPRIITSGILTTVIVLYTIIGVHDYFAWNRARWDALNYLTDELKISPRKIDGGYEFNGWKIGIWYPPVEGKSWWFVDSDEYTISPTPQDGSDILTQYEYVKYYPFGDDEIYVIHKKTN